MTHTCVFGCSLLLSSMKSELVCTNSRKKNDKDKIIDFTFLRELTNSLGNQGFPLVGFNLVH